MLILFLSLAFWQTPATQTNADPVDHALDLIRQAKHEQAYTELRDVVKADPSNARALAFLAAMELQTGRLDDCQRHVDELTSKDPKNPDVRELTGQLFMARRDWKQAEGEWRWILGERPNSEQAHMQLAAVLLQQDRFQEALSEVSRSLEINPRRSDARSLRGNIQASLGRMEDAALDWNIALVGDSNDTVALSGLAVYLRNSQPEKSLSYAKQAVDLTGGKALGPIRVLSLVYRTQGENDKARQLIERAMLTFPNNEALVAELNAMKNPLTAKNPVPVATKPATGPAPAEAKAADARAPKLAPEPPASASVSTAAAKTPPPTAGKALPPPNVKTGSAKSVPPVLTASKPAAPPPAPPPAPTPGYVPPPLAFGGLTIGTALSDLTWMIRPALPPAPEKEKIVAGLAPRGPTNSKSPRFVTKESVDIPPPELFWGRLPLSTITPAFVYASVPPPAAAAPTSLGEAARRIREQKKPKP